MGKFFDFFEILTFIKFVNVNNFIKVLSISFRLMSIDTGKFLHEKRSVKPRFED